MVTASSIAEKIMEADDAIWSAHNWGSGGDVVMETYKKELQPTVESLKPTIVTKLEDVVDYLTSENYHTACTALEEMLE